MFPQHAPEPLKINALIDGLDGASLEAIGRFVMGVWLVAQEAEYLSSLVVLDGGLDEDDEDFPDIFFDDHRY